MTKRTILSGILIVFAFSLFQSCSPGPAEKAEKTSAEQQAPNEDITVIPESEKPVKPKIKLMEAATIDTCDGVFEGYWDEKVNENITCSVSLLVTVENCEVSKITITDSTWLHSEAARKIPATIIEKQSLPVDAISGASVASWTIMTATAVALGIDIIELEESAAE